MSKKGTNWPSNWYGEGVWNLPDPYYPCLKKKFPNKHEAKAAIRHIRATMKGWERKDGKATPYKCNNCGLWHWGHKRGWKDDAQGDRTQLRAT